MLLHTYVLTNYMVPITATTELLSWSFGPYILIYLYMYCVYDIILDFIFRPTCNEFYFNRMHPYVRTCIAYAFCMALWNMQIHIWFHHVQKNLWYSDAFFDLQNKNLKYSLCISYIYLFSKNVLWVKVEKILKDSLDSIHR